jgi:ketosteroid isomerase-like protein
MSEEEREIRALLASRDAAIAAGDAEAAVAAVATGATSYDLPPPLAFAHEHDGAVAGLNDWFATWDGPVRSDLRDPTIHVAGDLAIAWGLANMRGVKRGEGAQDLWFRSTIVLRRTDDGWQIIHEHNSVPLRMDGSGKAATDLKPEQKD